MRLKALAGALVLSAALAGGYDGGRWMLFRCRGGKYQATGTAQLTAVIPPRACPRMRLPKTWQVEGEAWLDVTGDGINECVTLVWRPWRDWPTQRWASRLSPIRNLRDAAGLSAHIAVLRPLPGGAYRELWVGSAMYRPAITMRVGDLTGDGKPDLALIETTYARTRTSPGGHIAVWQWTGFGFELACRSPQLTVSQLEMTRGPDGKLRGAAK